MADILLGVGSNIERERYITAGLDALQGLLGDMALSPVYDSAAVGFEGQPFLNLALAARTDLSLSELLARLRHIEYEHGRPANATRFSARQLDIDILAYDDLVGDFDGVVLPRDEILFNSFVLRPLADLVPGRRHPEDGRTYAELWQALGPKMAPLTRIAFSWRGREISSAA